MLNLAFAGIAVFVCHSSNRQIGYAVAVKVADIGNGRTELVGRV